MRRLWIHDIIVEILSLYLPSYVTIDFSSTGKDVTATGSEDRDSLAYYTQLYTASSVVKRKWSFPPPPPPRRRGTKKNFFYQADYDGMVLE